MLPKAETADDGDKVVDVYAADVPPAVRQAVLDRMSPGDTLWRCPRAKGHNGMFNFHSQPVVIEWWLIDQHGELVEAFWEM